MEMAGQTKIRVFDQLHGVPKTRNLVVPFTIARSEVAREIGSS